MSDRFPADLKKWIVAGSVILGGFLSVMDANVVNLALPDMMKNFGTDLTGITWVATVYSIAQIVAVTMVGWSTTLLGRKRLFMWSMALFTISSALSGTAHSLTQMVIYRTLQGAASGSLIPCSQAIVSEAFPVSEQGKAMAVYSAGIGCAPAIGPVIGGLLIDRFGWPSIFFINVPFCIVGLIMVRSFVQDPSYLRRGLKQVDLTGIVLLTIGISMLQLILANLEQVNWLASRTHMIEMAVTLVILLVLAVWELRQTEPVIDLHLLRNRDLANSSALGGMSWLMLYGTSFMVPQFTQGELGYSAYQTGLLLIPRAILMLAVTPIAGRFYTVSPKIIMVAGTLLQAATAGLLALQMVHPTFLGITLSMVPMGIGLGIATVILMGVSLNSVARAEKTAAAGLYTLARREGGNLAYVIFANIIAFQTRYHSGHPGAGAMTAHAATSLAYRDAYIVLAAVMLACLPLALRMPGRDWVSRQAAEEVEGVKSAEVHMVES